MIIRNGYEFKKINGLFYIIDKDRQATGNTLREALVNFKHKYAKQYIDMGLDKKLTIEQLKDLYGIITSPQTGCKEGIDAYEEQLKEQEPLLYKNMQKNGYSINELMELLDEQGGALEFKNFFKK